MYTFTNMYLSQIQRGIQSAHCITDMLVKYNQQFNDFHESSRGPQFEFLLEWMENDKTMIVLNGGGSEELNSLHSFCKGARNSCIYPFGVFFEEDTALGGSGAGALTCFGILLPESIYMGARELRAPEPEKTLLDRLFNNKKSKLEELEETKTMCVPRDGVTTNVWQQQTFNNWEIKLMQRLNRYSLA